MPMIFASSKGLMRFQPTIFEGLGSRCIDKSSSHNKLAQGPPWLVMTCPYVVYMILAEKVPMKMTTFIIDE